MKVVILAAGYATRLYPLTLTQPKALLPVAGKPMIQFVLDRLAGFPGVDQFILVTNSRFRPQFEEWLPSYAPPPSANPISLKILDDGSTADDNKRGALGDLRFALDQEGLQDDLIVVAADNLFSESLEGFAAMVQGKPDPVLAIHDSATVNHAKHYGVVVLDPKGQILRFVEKPESPESTLVGVALYYYPRRVLPLIHQYFAEGNNHDQPGHLIEWLYPRTPIYTWTAPGIWYDIGSKEALAEANRIFSRLETTR